MTEEALSKGEWGLTETPMRTMRRLADVYALTADMLENETGDWIWVCGPVTVEREEGGLTICDALSGRQVHYAEAGEAGDYIARIVHWPGSLWDAVETQPDGAWVCSLSSPEATP